MSDEKKITTIFDEPAEDEQMPEGEDGCVMGCKCKEQFLARRHRVDASQAEHLDGNHPCAGRYICRP